MRRIVALLVLAACRQPPPPPAAPYDVAVAAARARFHEAQVRLHDWLLAYEAPDLDALVDAENRLDAETKRALEATARRGVAAAEQAIAARPEGVAGHLYLGLNLAIVGLSIGKAAALFEGIAGKTKAAWEEAQRLDPAFEAGGAHRLQGKFLISAPWPVGDLAAGGRALQQSRAVHPDPLTDLYLGDWHHRAGRPARAREAWRRALRTPAHPSTRHLETQVRELARRRLRSQDNPHR